MLLVLDFVRPQLLTCPCLPVPDFARSHYVLSSCP